MQHKNLRTSDLIKTAIIAVLVFFCLPLFGYSQTEEVNTWIQRLKDVRWHFLAPYEMAKIGSPVVEPLIKELLDKNNDIKIKSVVITTLGMIKDSRSTEPLIAILRDKDDQLRRLAETGLGEIKDARAVEPLIVILKDENENKYVRSGAATALGRIKDSYGVLPLIDMLKDKDSHVRREAALALG